jgi:hypothetical protein
MRPTDVSNDETFFPTTPAAEEWQTDFLRALPEIEELARCSSVFAFVVATHLLSWRRASRVTDYKPRCHCNILLPSIAGGTKGLRICL